MIDIDVKFEAKQAEARIISYIEQMYKHEEPPGPDNMDVAGRYGAFVSAQVRKVKSAIKIAALMYLKDCGVDVTQHSARQFLIDAGVSSISYSTANKLFTTPGRASANKTAVKINTSDHKLLINEMKNKIFEAGIEFVKVKKRCRKIFKETYKN